MGISNNRDGSNPYTTPSASLTSEEIPLKPARWLRDAPLKNAVGILNLMDSEWNKPPLFEYKAPEKFIGFSGKLRRMHLRKCDIVAGITITDNERGKHFLDKKFVHTYEKESGDAVLTDWRDIIVQLNLEMPGMRPEPYQEGEKEAFAKARVEVSQKFSRLLGLANSVSDELGEAAAPYRLAAAADDIAEHLGQISNCIELPAEQRKNMPLNGAFQIPVSRSTAILDQHIEAMHTLMESNKTTKDMIPALDTAYKELSECLIQQRYALDRADHHFLYAQAEQGLEKALAAGGGRGGRRNSHRRTASDEIRSDMLPGF